MGWRWCSPTRKRGLGCARIGPQGYDPLIGQERVPSTTVGFHAVLQLGPLIRLCLVRRPIAVFATHDDLLTGVCRQIDNHGPKRCKIPPPPRQPYRRAARPDRKRWSPTDPPDDPPDDPGVHFSTDTQVRRVRNGAKRMTSTGFARPDEARTRKASSTRSARQPRTGAGTLLGRTRERVIGRQGLCQQGQPGAARHRPLAGFGKTRGQAELQTPLEGLRNAYATTKHRPIVRAGQNKRPAGDGGNRITRPPKSLCLM